MVAKVLWVTFLEAMRPLSQLLNQHLQLHLHQRQHQHQLRLWLLLLRNHHLQRLMPPSRFQLGFRAAGAITTTIELMARTLETFLRIALRPRSMLPLVVDLPWATSLVETEGVILVHCSTG